MLELFIPIHHASLRWLNNFTHLAYFCVLRAKIKEIAGLAEQLLLLLVSIHA